MKAYRMSKSRAPGILNLDTRRRCSTSLPGRITPGKEIPAPIEWELGMPDCRCERFLETRKPFIVAPYITESIYCSLTNKC